LYPGTIIDIKRGFVNYALWPFWTKQGVYFVTRLKENADYRIVQKNPVPENGNMLKDQLIYLQGFYSKKCSFALRIIVIRDPRTKERFTFITNNMKLPASTIAMIYKDRWQNELIFKALKQNLRIKTFGGTFFNDDMIQIWTAVTNYITKTPSFSFTDS